MFLRRSHPPPFPSCRQLEGLTKLLQVLKLKPPQTMSATQTHQQHHLQDGKGRLGHGGVSGGEITNLPNNIRYPETTCHMRNGDFVMSKKNHHPNSPHQLLALFPPKSRSDWHLWSIVQRTGLRLRKTPIINPHSRVGVFFFPVRSINLVA